jgi:hypothetical protein
MRICRLSEPFVSIRNNLSRIFEHPADAVPGQGPEFGLRPARRRGNERLEHVPKKLLAFFDSAMLQLFEFERFLFDHVIPRNQEAL